MLYIFSKFLINPYTIELVWFFREILRTSSRSLRTFSSNNRVVFHPWLPRVYFRDSISYIKARIGLSDFNHSLSLRLWPRIKEGAYQILTIRRWEKAKKMFYFVTKRPVLPAFLPGQASRNNVARRLHVPRGRAIYFRCRREFCASNRRTDGGFPGSGRHT